MCVVIWCSIEMRNSASAAGHEAVPVVIWCSIEMRNSANGGAHRAHPVVIWCSIEMRNSLKVDERVLQSGCDLMLYWNEKQCDKVVKSKRIGCDLMLYWNEKQSRCDCVEGLGVVIWCSIEMRNSALQGLHFRFNVVIWCSIEMRNSS